MKRLKKFGSLVLASTVLTISASPIALGASEGESGIDLDDFISSMKSGTSSVISVMSSIVDGDKVSVSGGTLWAQFKGSSHRAKYDHSSKEHRSTAVNSAGHSLTSSWTDAGYTATTEWCSSTLTGNKVYGATR